jgi:TolB protein
MSIMTQRRLNWFLGGVVFLMVLATAGCSRTSSPHPRYGWEPAAARQRDHRPAEPKFADAPAAATATRPPRVNAYGEISGALMTEGPVRGANYQRHTFLDEGDDIGISIDPTGRWMVYSSTRHSPHANLYLQRVDGLSVTQLTNRTADDAFPSFSPDGRRVAYSSTRSGSWDIYVMDVDGRNVTQITDGPMHDLHPSFSPCGTRLVYCSTGGRSGQWELWLVNLVTGERKMIGYGLFPRWSPDATVDRIAFQRSRQRGLRWFSLWTLDLVDDEARRVTEVAASSNAAIVSPTWSPDGRRLAFATVVEPVDGRRAQHDIWIINVDGTGRQRVTDGVGTNLSPYWSADHRVYFVSDRGGRDSIWSVRAETGNLLHAGADAATME